MNRSLVDCRPGSLFDRAIPIAILLAFVAAGTSSAAPVFWVSPGYDLMLDLPWQAAAGTFDEIDFDSYANASIVNSFTLGGVAMPGVTVSPYIPGASGPTQGAEIFVGSWGSTSQYGNVYDRALLSRNPSSGAQKAMIFNFSRPVYGLGMWFYDNGIGSIDSFQMTVNGATSAVLDANPGGGAHTVEGFLGVTDPAGITSALVFNCSGTAVFEIDHFQVSTVPEPASLGLVGLGAGLTLGAFLRRRRP